jgi:hypothetical protein
MANNFADAFLARLSKLKESAKTSKQQSELVLFQTTGTVFLILDANQYPEHKPSEETLKHLHAEVLGFGRSERKGEDVIRDILQKNGWVVTKQQDGNIRVLWSLDQIPIDIRGGKDVSLIHKDETWNMTMNKQDVSWGTLVWNIMLFGDKIQRSVSYVNAIVDAHSPVSNQWITGTIIGKSPSVLVALAKEYSKEMDAKLKEDLTLFQIRPLSEGQSSQLDFWTSRAFIAPRGTRIQDSFRKRESFLVDDRIVPGDIVFQKGGRNSETFTVLSINSKTKNVLLAKRAYVPDDKGDPILAQQQEDTLQRVDSELQQAILTRALHEGKVLRFVHKVNFGLFHQLLANHFSDKTNIEDYRRFDFEDSKTPLFVIPSPNSDLQITLGFQYNADSDVVVCQIVPYSPAVGASEMVKLGFEWEKWSDEDPRVAQKAMEHFVGQTLTFLVRRLVKEHFIKESNIKGSLSNQDVFTFICENYKQLSKRDWEESFGPLLVARFGDNAKKIACALQKGQPLSKDDILFGAFFGASAPKRMSSLETPLKKKKEVVLQKVGKRSANDPILTYSIHGSSTPIGFYSELLARKAAAGVDFARPEQVDDRTTHQPPNQKEEEVSVHIIPALWDQEGWKESWESLHVYNRVAKSNFILIFVPQKDQIKGTNVTLSKFLQKVPMAFAPDRQVPWREGPFSDKPLQEFIPERTTYAHVELGLDGQVDWSSPVTRQAILFLMHNMQDIQESLLPPERTKVPRESKRGQPLAVAEASSKDIERQRAFEMEKARQMEEEEEERRIAAEKKRKEAKKKESAPGLGLSPVEEPSERQAFLNEIERERRRLAEEEERKRQLAVEKANKEKKESVPAAPAAPRELTDREKQAAAEIKATAELWEIKPGIQQMGVPLRWMINPTALKNLQFNKNIEENKIRLQEFETNLENEIKSVFKMCGFEVESLLHVFAEDEPVHVYFHPVLGEDLEKTDSSQGIYILQRDALIQAVRTGPGAQKADLLVLLFLPTNKGEGFLGRDSIGGERARNLQEQIDTKDTRQRYPKLTTLTLTRDEYEGTPKILPLEGSNRDISSHLMPMGRADSENNYFFTRLRKIPFALNKYVRRIAELFDQKKVKSFSRRPIRPREDLEDYVDHLRRPEYIQAIRLLNQYGGDIAKAQDAYLKNRPAVGSWTDYV